MRRFVSRAALIVYVLSVAAVVHAQTVDEIVAKNLQAKGGAEKWKAVTSVKMTGKVTMQGKELPIVVYAKRPNSNRQEIGPPEMRVVQAFDGTSAWAMMGGQPPNELPPAAAEMMKNGADFDGALIGPHRGLDAAQSQALNARLVLLLANHVGSLAVLREALQAARDAG